MRVRVRFRYRADTGEVETFLVEDLGGDERATDHDARHDRATADVARIIEQNARIEEVLPGSLSDAPISTPSATEDPSRQADRGVHE
ncbi:MAG: hypothetical protein ACRDTG_02890 [Pseudonocardiaceae bacterium]